MAARTLCGVRGNGGASGAGGRGWRRVGGGGGRSHSWLEAVSSPAKRRRMRGRKMTRMMNTRSLRPGVCTQGGRGWCPGDQGAGRGHCRETRPRCHPSHTPQLGPEPRARAP